MVLVHSSVTKDTYSTDICPALAITQAINDRGQAVLDGYQSRLGTEATLWSSFIAAAAQSTAQTSVLIVATSITAFIILLVIISNRYYWISISSPIVLLTELTSVTSTVISFGCAISLALSLRAFSTPPYSTLDSADLTFFALLDPLSRALAITSTLTGLLIIITCTAHTIDFMQQRKRSKDIRSFEPTVSALGMSHGFHALHPAPRRVIRESIPTMYDPYGAFRNGPGSLSTAGRLPNTVRLQGVGRLPSAEQMITKQVTFANEEGAWMSRKHSRWSVSTVSPSTAAPTGMARIEGDILRLLEVKRARRAVPVRPARPSSGVHAI